MPKISEIFVSEGKGLDLWGVLSSGGLNEIDSRQRTEYCRDRKKYVSSVS